MSKEVVAEPPGDLPPHSASTSEWIAYGERAVGTRFGSELAEHLSLAEDVLNFAGRLVDRVGEEPGEPRVIHVQAIILSRQISELAACSHLIRLGYAPQAITLVGTMLELAHVGAYIAGDDDRAMAWLAWEDPARAYPGSVKKTIKAVGRLVGAKDDVIAREHDVIYRRICQVKHGNTVSIGATSIAARGDATYFLSGPILSEDYIRLGHVAMHWGIRYALLSVAVMVEFALPTTQRRDFSAELSQLVARNGAMIESSKERFPPTKQSRDGH